MPLFRYTGDLSTRRTLSPLATLIRQFFSWGVKRNMVASTGMSISLSFTAFNVMNCPKFRKSCCEIKIYKKLWHVSLYLEEYVFDVLSLLKMLLPFFIPLLLSYLFFQHFSQLRQLGIGGFWVVEERAQVCNLLSQFSVRRPQFFVELFFFVAFRTSAFVVHWPWGFSSQPARESGNKNISMKHIWNTQAT